VRRAGTTLGTVVAPAELAERGSLIAKVLELMAQGLTNAAIANRLVVSERTVEAHIRHILTKLDITDSEDGHRRVLAVLAYLNGGHQT
jgi:DNA-binding NarL/FixJ family response regulator